MAVTRIKNNQIFDKTITAQKIADASLVGALFSPELLLNSNITITGNLAVIGQSSTVSSTNTYVNDPLVVFNNGYTGLPSYDVGILVNRNLNPFNTAWIWNEGSQAFEGILTSDTGGTVGTINNSGYVTVKTGNIVAVTSGTIGNINIAQNVISSTDTNANIALTPNGTGLFVVSANTVPGTANTLNLGAATTQYNTVYAQTFNANGAVISTSGGNLTLTPANGGQTVIANLTISGTGSTFSGYVVSNNAVITGGSINGTIIGNSAPAAGTFTSIVDTGSLTADGVNAAISLAPTGSGTVTINPATTGTISNMAGSFTTLQSSSTTTLAHTSATSLTTANAQVTGGAVSGVAITSSPISGSTGSFTTLAANGNTSLTGSTVTVSGIESITNATQSTTPSDGALIVAGGVGVGKDVNIGGNLDVAQSTNLGSITVNATGAVSSSGNISISSTASVKIGSLAYPQTDAAAGTVVMTDGAGNLTLQPIVQIATADQLTLGNTSVGTLVDNNPAITTWTSGTYVTDAVDKLNEVLGKLVPPAPPAFPNGTLTISSTSSGLRMTDFTQTNNTTTGSKQLAAGVAVSAYRRVSSYTTNTFTNVGPGESGNVVVNKNSVASGSHVIVPTLTNNGTYGELIISNNVDYGTITGKALLFWNSFNASVSGTVSAGWNEVNVSDSAAGTTNTALWYYDASAPGTPVVTISTVLPTTEVVSNSSSIPHYTSSTQWTVTGTANRLSGDLYPATDTFLTGSAGGAFQAPASVTYTAAGVTTPLIQNLYVASGSASWSTTAATVNTTGSSSTGATVSVNNSYATGTATASPGGVVLTINTSDTSKVNENNIVVGTFGSGGTASAVRVDGLGTGATPATGSISAWSSNAALLTYEATVVGGVAKNDVTNYSTGYFPVGPDLSVGRTGTQYITFQITRDATSKFDIAVTGKFSGCQVAIPGSSVDTTAAPTNGWIDPTVAYTGSGIPGTGVGGNGSVGCALGGPLATGTLTTQSKTVTFGTESSHNSTGNHIYVRFALAAGDSITALSFANPTH